MDVSSVSPGTVVTFLLQEVLLVDATSSLHPFFTHQLDAGPIRRTTIAHAFNYRIAVFRDGVKSAAWFGRSRREAEWILEDIVVSLGHQVVVMFQIVCALALEVPSVLQDIEKLHGVLPSVVRVSPRIAQGAYVHDLLLIAREFLSVDEMEDFSATAGGDEPATWCGSGAPGICAICVSLAWGLWLPAPDCLCAMEDGSSGGV